MRASTGELLRTGKLTRLVMPQRLSAGPGALIAIDSFMYQWPRTNREDSGPRRSSRYRVLALSRKEPASDAELAALHAQMHKDWQLQRGAACRELTGPALVQLGTVVAVSDSLELATALGSRIARGLEAQLINAQRAPRPMASARTETGPQQIRNLGDVQRSIAQLEREHSSDKPLWVLRRSVPDGEALTAPRDLRWLWLLAIGGLAIVSDATPLDERLHQLILFAATTLLILARWTRIELRPAGVRVSTLFLGFEHGPPLRLDWKQMYELKASEQGLTVQMRDDARLVPMPRTGARWLARQLRRWLQRQAWALQSEAGEGGNPPLVLEPESG